MKIVSAEFVTSAAEAFQYPETSCPEVAFAGRSNVGKSSLINTLANRKDLARTSNTPGRTRLINFYVINRAWGFVDLPGYGYAKVSEEVRRGWGPMVETYLERRKNLRLVLLVLDIRRDPSEKDHDLIQWLLSHRVPFRLILTKADKLSRSRMLARKSEIEKLLDLPEGAPLIIFSAKTGQGRDDIWKIIQHMDADTVRERIDGTTR